MSSDESDDRNMFPRRSAKYSFSKVKHGTLLPEVPDVPVSRQAYVTTDIEDCFE